ncbi:flagellar biosynthesis repressor FlbT [Pelagibacterium halotolerans]|uniref:flagellar biosynthesis repressor FlbT n=1 Tax=Pelagibacterium halotolerans TaxID=531813 RepID=UPI00384F83C8
MALKVELKPGEKMLIGNSVITNSDQRTRLYIEGSAPILREKDILTPKTADTPAKSLYLAIQIMYVEQNVEKLQKSYFELVNDIVKAAPSTLPYIDQINNEILTGDLYKALRIARKLIDYEGGLLSNVSTRSSGVSTDGPSNG